MDIVINFKNKKLQTPRFFKDIQKDNVETKEAFETKDIDITSTQAAEDDLSQAATHDLNLSGTVSEKVISETVTAEISKLKKETAPTTTPEISKSENSTLEFLQEITEPLLPAQAELSQLSEDLEIAVTQKTKPAVPYRSEKLLLLLIILIILSNK
ncbi:MAG: hypothetical protein GX893_03050 [Firmicutes bacterium]|nr:hypothetical protein [Bacillota bacterium]